MIHEDCSPENVVEMTAKRQNKYIFHRALHKCKSCKKKKPNNKFQNYNCIFV